MKNKPQHWGNRFLFIMALISSAVGLGNIWRFPYIAREEGIYFLILYVIFVFSIGIPALYIEVYAGSHFKHSLTKLSNKILKKRSFLSIIPFFVVLAVSSYYTVISGWTLAFSILPLSFHSFEKSFLPLVFSVFVNLFAMFIVSKDLHHGIEMINKYFMTIFFFFLFILFVISAPWDHMNEVFGNLKTDLNFGTVVSALSQSLFSLSLGVGLIYTYSFFARHKGMLSSSIITAIVDTLIAFVAFIMISSFYFSYNIETQSPVEFSFVVMKDILSNFPYSPILRFSFFFFLFTASFTSVISFYSFLKFNLPKELKFLYYLPLILSSIISIDFILNIDLIYLIDRGVVEPLLPISLLITMYIFIKYYLSTKSHSSPSEKLPIKNNL